MLEKFGRPTTLGESLRAYLGIPAPVRAALVERGEAVMVILDGEARVAPGRYLSRDRKRRGKIRVQLDALRNAGVSRTVMVERWRVLRRREDGHAHHGG